MSLREKIIGCIVPNTPLDKQADAILALPSGMVAVTGCKGCKENKPCDSCDGVRSIRDMSIQEVVEWAKSEAQYKNDNFAILNLPSGERVEVKI